MTSWGLDGGLRLLIIVQKNWLIIGKIPRMNTDNSLYTYTNILTDSRTFTDANIDYTDIWPIWTNILVSLFNDYTNNIDYQSSPNVWIV